MTDDLNSELDKIFTARAERLDAAAQAQQEAEVRADTTLQEFLALKEALIRPTLESLANKLSDRGQESRIVEIQDGEHVGGKVSDASIGIRFWTDRGAAIARGNEYPHLTLVLEKSRRKVNFFRSTMSPGKSGMAGSDGSVDLGLLTEDLINQKALEIIAAIYR
ncbi:hypothetical protein SAMN03159512_01827 [Pseudomonas sp. NFR09]|uniref:hypothetical protein n=1 Tax=Pseudomonas sp. NFR09 TaxID=1566249 RepID=UPI0008B8D0F7|nr:hypothetical protein [Pseudomonas sp. NFR09]SET27738.1 hypothetical protein SAMN03159512_01827 [Pseudomonas sp. NFR09]